MRGGNDAVRPDPRGPRGSARIGEHGLGSFGLEQALLFQDELEATFALLAENPAIGFIRTEYAPEAVRFFVKRPAVIAYRWEARPIEVLRVIVGSLDFMR